MKNIINKPIRTMSLKELEYELSISRNPSRIKNLETEIKIRKELLKNE